MTLVVMVLLGALMAAGSLVAPVAVLELRQGREVFHRAAIRGATEAAVAQAFPGGWVASAVGAPQRTRLSIPSVAVRPGVIITLEAEAMVADLWLFQGRGSITDGAGSPLAASRTGWLVRVAVFPPDSVPRARLIGRPWVAGFE